MKKTLIIAVAAFLMGGVATRAFADPQPRMKAALVQLEAALGELEKADHDKGGHRVKAVQLVKDAISEVKAGIEFDNKH